MRKYAVLQLGLLFSVLCYSSISGALTPIPTSLQPGLKMINQSTLRDEVTLLASDRFQGRLSLTAGDEAATQWIATQFQQAGLSPINQHYLQAVPIIQYQPDTKKSYVALKRGQEKQQWRMPDVYTEFPSAITLTGKVIFAGYGITAPEFHYDDYRQQDVRGKIVLVFEHEPQEKNPHSTFKGLANTIYATFYTKALNAQKHGAIALFIAPEPNRDHPSNQERRARISGLKKRLNTMPSQVLVNSELHIPVVILSDKVANAIVNKKQLSQWQTDIDKKLTPQTIALRDITLTLHDENKSRQLGTVYNVVGLLEGSDPTLKAETILISAHHDHDGQAGKKILPGADDNASGTVGVITLARAFVNNAKAENGLKPKRSLLFVVFAAEERGLLGAFYLTTHPLRPLATTRAMINFDMIGRNEKESAQTAGLITIPADTSNRLNLIGSHYSNDYQQTVAQMNQYVNLDLDNRFDQDYALNVFFRSDQFPFVLQHIPAFWWFTGFHPDYHQTTDTADKINYSKMQKILELAYLSGFAFANEENSPNFISA